MSARVLATPRAWFRPRSRGREYGLHGSVEPGDFWDFRPFPDAAAPAGAAARPLVQQARYLEREAAWDHWVTVGFRDLDQTYARREVRDQ